MTLCIAAKCDYEGKRAIIMASDLRIEDDVAVSETAIKQDTLVPGWEFMYAGRQGRATQLVITLRDHLAKHPLERFKATEILTQAVRTHREKMADEYIHTRIAKSYEWLLTEGQEALPQDLYSQLIHSIGNIQLDTQLIICGFLAGRPTIYVIDESRGLPYVRPVENFAAIGSGATIAEAMLHYRSHHGHTTLKVAAYHVCEAKRLGEMAPGVGYQTTFSVLFSDGSVAESGPSFVPWMDQKWNEYAPRPIGLVSDWSDLGNGFLDIRPGVQLDHLQQTTTDEPLRPPLLESPEGSDES